MTWSDERDDVRDVEQGDLVDFGPYGRLYVCNLHQFGGGWWVTENEEDRFNPNAPGHSIIPEWVDELVIIEKYDDFE